MRHERGTLAYFEELFELAPAAYIVTDAYLTIEDANRAAGSAGRALLRRAPDTAQARLVEGLRTLDKSELRGLADYLSTLDEILVENATEGRTRHSGSSRVRRQA